MQGKSTDKSNRSLMALTWHPRYLLTKTVWLISGAFSWEGELTRGSKVCDVAHWMIRTQHEGLQHSNYHLSSPLSAICLVCYQFEFMQDQKIRRIKQQHNLSAQAATQWSRAVKTFIASGQTHNSWMLVEETRRIKGFSYSFGSTESRL